MKRRSEMKLEDRAIWFWLAMTVASGVVMFMFMTKNGWVAGSALLATVWSCLRAIKHLNRVEDLTRNIGR